MSLKRCLEDGGRVVPELSQWLWDDLKGSGSSHLSASPSSGYWFPSDVSPSSCWMATAVPGNTAAHRHSLVQR